MPIINTKPDMNYGVWAEGGNIEIPSSEKVEEGWVVEKPLNEQMNWLQNRQDKMLQYLNQRGIPEWDSRTEYPIDAYVSRAGTLYQALSQNTDRDPTLHQAIWKIAFVGYDEFVTYAEDIQSIKDTDGFLKHYVKKSDPVMDSAVKAPSYNNKEMTAGVTFSDDVVKVSKGNTVVAEFSGGTNPKDVVTHEQLMQAIQVFKVGAVYTSVRPDDPAEVFGYGTWERFAEGKTLVGVSTSISNSVPEWVKRAGSEYGEYDHKITKDEMPTHSHGVGGYGGTSGGGGAAAGNDISVIFNTRPEGGDKPHNNVQPSIVVYFWKRVA
ncbi:tail fiber protein [Edwardsiella phage vB_EtaM_ET-ABTNL-9]|nr:tail fiber protein [Edwardsiella phage vB_EtaM_ET-ABTNL-9]